MMVKRALIRVARTEKQRKELERMSEAETIELLKKLNLSLKSKKE